MAGLYLHIPFCRKVCYYCDFHFTVSFKQKQRVLDAIKKELILRNEEFQSISFDSLYFGGGTPSVLNQEEWVELFQCIHLHYKIQSTAEITIEANPDDLTNNYLQELKENTPINRLSIGVQSFDDRFLKLMNRRHTAGEAMESIKRAVKAGFRNINIDLIYGIPGMTADIWKYNLQVFSELNIPHLSAYHLTIEPRTVFAYY
ncbi:MAG: coproporphyrinogen-III oxidase family protein, partial [Anaerolineales bacterium]